MSRALFVSDRASLPSSQTFVRLIPATGLHRRVTTRSRTFFVSWCPYGTKVVSPRDTRVLTPTFVDCVPTRHTGSYAHLHWLCPHATHGFLRPPSWLCPHATHGFDTHPSYCVPPQHNTLYHPDTGKCYDDVMWSASGFFIVSEVVSTHVNTVIKINGQNSEQC